jgi:carbon monoxide dehydrogenase subunit G
MDPGMLGGIAGSCDKEGVEIKGEYRIAAPRETVWQALNDPRMLKACIPGCEEFEKDGDGEFRAKIMTTIGPVRARFNTTLSLEDLNPPESYRIVGESKAAAGFGRGSAAVNLSDTEDGTLLRYDADFRVGGKLAQVGSRLVIGATRKTADDFFSAFSTTLDPGGYRIDVEPEPGKATTLRKTWCAVAAALVVLLIWWFLLR